MNVKRTIPRPELMKGATRCLHKGQTATITGILEQQWIHQGGRKQEQEDQHKMVAEKKKKERDQERGGGTVRALGENNAPDENNNQPVTSSAPRLIGPDLFC